MLFDEIVSEIRGKTLFEDEKKRDYKIACATDMLSELLMLGKEGAILITGLCTPQVVSTADIVGVEAILIVRGKNVPLDTVKKAKELSIPLAVTDMTMFATCGILFKKGLKDVNGQG